MTAPRCPLHVGTEMLAVETCAPRFLVILADGEQGKRRAKRTIFRCPITGCNRVAAAEDNGIDWSEARVCRLCGKNAVDGESAARADYRCAACLRGKRKGGRRTRGRSIVFSLKTEVYA